MHQLRKLARAQSNNNLNYFDMCKIKQLNGEAPRFNNYCTAREYEVFLIISKDENLKVGDLIDGEKLVNKTAGRIWEITECNRTEGGHVTIKDNKGNIKTCMFVFGKGGKNTPPQKKQEEQTQQQEEQTKVQTNNNTTNNSTMNNNNTNSNGMEQVANIFANLQSDAYNKGYNAAQEEYSAKIDNLTAQVEELKNKPTTTGTVINITIGDKKHTHQTERVLHPEFEWVMFLLANRRHVYLHGPAGSGKTEMAIECAKSLGLDFEYQNQVILRPDVQGFVDANGTYHDTPITRAASKGKLLICDEVDGWSPNALLCLNGLLSQGFIDIPNYGRINAHPDFYVVACGNTNGLGATALFNSRNKLCESDRDRFKFVEINYDPAVEKSIVGEHTDILDFINDLRTICKDTKITLTLGYRCIKDLADFYDYPHTEKVVESCIFKGLKRDSVREILSRMTVQNKYYQAVKKLAK